MFATLSGFLPSALQPGSPNPAIATNKDVPPVVVEDPKPSDVIGATEEGGVKRKERRTNHEVRFGDLNSPLPIPHLPRLCLVVHRRAASTCKVQSPLEPPGPARPSAVS